MEPRASAPPAAPSAAASPAWIALAVLACVALGLALRLAPLPERRLSSDERDLGPSRWLVDDPATAGELRRVELALAEGRAPRSDPFLCHTAGAEVPALPLFSALFAGTAERWLAHAEGADSLRGVAEADLEAFAAWSGPALALAALLACAWAASEAARGRGAAVAAALAVVALAPAAVRAGEVGRLDPAGLGLVVAALCLRSALRAVRASDAQGLLLEALLAGVLAGLLSALSAAGALLGACAGVALWLRAWREQGELRALCARAGVLFALAAAFLARLPLSEGPWESLPPGIVARQALVASDLLLAVGLPCAWLAAVGPRAERRGGLSRAVMPVLALGFAAFEGPRAAQAGWELAQAAWRAHAALTEVEVQLAGELASPLAGGGRLPWLADLSLTAAFGGAAVAWLALRRCEPAQVLLALAALATFALAAWERAFAPAAVLCGALGLGAWLATFERVPRLVGLALALSLAPHALAPLLARPDPALREERIAFLAGLRWLREGSQAGGPFNSSHARSTWGVLIDPALAPLAIYHARRPVAAAPAAAWSAPGALLDALRLARTAGADELERGMRAAGLSYAVSAPRLAAAGRGVLRELAFADRERAPFAFAHRSPRRVGERLRAPLAGERAGPAVSIWVLGETLEPGAPALRPR